jgi:hypothetical protein
LALAVELKDGIYAAKTPQNICLQFRIKDSGKSIEYEERLCGKERRAYRRATFDGENITIPGGARFHVTSATTSTLTGNWISRNAAMKLSFTKK